MTMPPDNEQHLYGSAEWAIERAIAKAGYYKKDERGLYLGTAYGRELLWNGEGAVLCVAPPRAGKFTGFGAYNCLTGYSQGSNKVFFSPKYEEAVVGFDQTAEERRCWYVSTTERYGLPRHRVNPVGHIHEDSPTLEDDVQAICKDALPESGGGNAKYFELTGQRVFEAFGLTIAEWDGELTLPAIADAANAVMGDDGAWEHFAEHMRLSRFAKVRAVEAEISAGKASGSNAFYGVISEVQNALSALSVSNVREAFSPPFDFTLEEFVTMPNCNLYLGPEAEFIKSQKLIWRTLISSIATLKRRHIDAPKIDLHMDEIVLLAPFPMLGDLVNFAPGYGLRTILVTQTLRQLDQLFEHGREVITGGVAVEMHIGVNNVDTARILSERLGTQTVYYDEDLARDQAALEAKRAADSLLSGGDPFKAGMEQKHFAKAAQHRSRRSRKLLDTEQLLHLPKGEGIIFADGMPHPIYAQFPPYFEQRRLAGRFLPSPFFPPADRVRVKSWLWHRWRKVHRGPPPPEFAAFPQYHDHDHLWVGK